MRKSTGASEAAAAAAPEDEPRKMTAADLTIPAQETDGIKPHRGMPAAKYIENVEAFVGEQNPAHVEAVAHELLMKYRCMEQALQREYERVGLKIEEMKESLEAVLLLQKKRQKKNAGEESGDLKLYFQLADTLQAEAVIPPTDAVWLWLGANVVMQYSLDEAEKLLTENMAKAKKLHATTEEDLQWLQMQITVAEVTIARVHNYGVSWRKKQQLEEEALRSGKHKRREVAV